MLNASRPNQTSENGMRTQGDCVLKHSTLYMIHRRMCSVRLYANLIPYSTPQSRGCESRSPARRRTKMATATTRRCEDSPPPLPAVPFYRFMLRDLLKGMPPKETKTIARTHWGGLFFGKLTIRRMSDVRTISGTRANVPSDILLVNLVKKNDMQI